DWLCRAQHGGMQLLVPVAGPFLYAADHPRDTILNKKGSSHGATTKALLYTSGGLQVLGLGLAVAAVATGKEEIVGGRDHAASSPSWFVTPQASGDMVGLTFGLHRW